MANLFDKGKYQCALYSVSGLCLFDDNYAPKKFCKQTKPYIFLQLRFTAQLFHSNVSLKLDLIWTYDPQRKTDGPRLLFIAAL